VAWPLAESPDDQVVGSEDPGRLPWPAGQDLWFDTALAVAAFDSLFLEAVAL